MKKNEESYQVLAGLLRNKMTNCWVKILADNHGIYVYPADEKREISKSSIVSSTAIFYIIDFCQQHKLEFFVSTNCERNCAYVMIY